MTDERKTDDTAEDGPRKDESLFEWIIRRHIERQAMDEKEKARWLN